MIEVVVVSLVFKPPECLIEPGTSARFRKLYGTSNSEMLRKEDVFILAGEFIV